MIVVGGESLIDLVSTGDAYSAHPGGSPYNVAIAAGRLGLEVGFLGRLSRDSFGDQLQARLMESKVDLRFCLETDEPTTLAIADIDAESKAARYSFYTEGTAGVGLNEADLPAELPDEVAAIHVGSFSLVTDPIGGALEALMRRERGKRVLAIDPNIRTMIIDDEASARKRLRDLIGLADLLKLSDEDLQWLAPGVSEEEFVGEWLSGGGALAVMTKGAEGSVAVTAVGKVEIPAQQVEVIDSIGAGDTFMAALLHWLGGETKLSLTGLQSLTGGDLEAMLQHAARAAALTCSRPGCDPPWESEL